MVDDEKNLLSVRKLSILELEYLALPVEERRNEKPLTSEQKEEAKAYAVSLGVSEDIIKFGGGDTGFICLMGTDILNIGSDALPSTKRSRIPNSNITLRGTIAHEVVGHLEAERGNFTQGEPLLEEVQASIRAARFAPGLNRQERITLIRDGVYRLKVLGVSLRDIKGRLHINKR